MTANPSLNGKPAHDKLKRRGKTLNTNKLTDVKGAGFPLSDGLDAQAEDDAKMFGIGFVIEGIGRVHPSRVRIFHYKPTVCETHGRVNCGRCNQLDDV